MADAFKQPLISVIVPVYNVEPYLKKCVDSIISQTYKNLEIILVDDGSPDNCPAICDEYEIKDKRVRVIHQENSGGSNARNSGIKIANGEYISFIDSDDWIAPELYETVMAKAPFEVIAFGIVPVNEDGKVLKKSDTPHTPIGYRNEGESVELKKAIASSFFGYSCNKVYSRKAIENIWFRCLSGRDDLRFNLDVLIRVLFFDTVDFDGYFYLQRQGSMLRCHSDTTAFLPFTEYMNGIIGSFPKKLYSDIYNIIVKQYLLDRIYWDIIINSKPTAPEKREAMKFMFSNKCIKKRLRFSRDDTQLSAMLVLCFKLGLPDLFLRIYKKGCRSA